MGRPAKREAAVGPPRRSVTRGWRPARAVGRGAATASLVAFVAGCGAGATPPSQIAENYINTIAEGNFARACAMIPSAARASFAGLIGRRTTCAQAFKRCVPEQATSTAQDQTQLFYTNVQTTITGSTAVADLSGTTVARAVKQVALTERHGVWSMSTYGTGLEACAVASRTPRRR
jgi:hypothetical protein